jgi:hypothetical protein
MRVYPTVDSKGRVERLFGTLQDRLITVVTAVMRKLLYLCYGVLKTRKSFDPCHAATGANPNTP